jgi:hypothetical protein
VPKEVMNFLGRKRSSQFQGEMVSDLSSFVCRRIGGCRIKHRVKQNWIKMYDKSGLVLRVETVINSPEELSSPFFEEVKAGDMLCRSTLLR